jgi:hypothetical protein
MDGPKPTTLQHNPYLLEYICNVYGTQDPKEVNPWVIDPRMRDAEDPSKPHSAAGRPLFLAPAVARTKVVRHELFFEGTPSQFSQKPPVIRLASAVNGDMTKFLPRPNKLRDRAQGVDPSIYSLNSAIINQMSFIADPKDSNSFNFPVGIGTNAIPRVLKEMQMEKIREMRESIEQDQDAPILQIHLPANCSTPMRMPLVNHVVNGYHNAAVARTFGGISSQQLWKGILFLSPQECADLHLPRPPPSHEPVRVPGQPIIYNTWALVPRNHVFCHCTSLEPIKLADMEYMIFDVRTAANEQTPFYLMDQWTIYQLAKATTSEALMKMDHRPIGDASVYVYPAFGNHSWSECCRPGQPEIPGRVTFSLIVKYTMFPNGCNINPLIGCSLDPEFAVLLPGQFDQYFTKEEEETKKHRAEK